MPALATSRIDALPIAAAAAAALVPRLTHLVFRVSGLQQLLTDNFLLPLTAAAGRPASKLKRLLLMGDITASVTASVTAVEATLAFQASIFGSKPAANFEDSRGGSATLHLAGINAAMPETRWHQALPQFSSLSDWSYTKMSTSRSC